MKSYVINLDRSPERLKHVLAQAQAAGLEMIRIAAVDGGAMSEAERLAITSRHFQFQPLNPGELGVFLSHRSAWRALVDSGEARAAIFEDDVVLAADLGSLLGTIDTKPPGCDIIKLESTLRPLALEIDQVPLGGRYQGSKLLSWHGGTAAYVISRTCAERLLLATDPVADTVDQVMFNPLSRISRRLDVMQVVPAPCVQHGILNRGGTSAIFGTTIRRRQRSGGFFHYGPWIDLRRVLQRCGETVLREFRSRLPGRELRLVPFAGADDTKARDA